jgi:hypothetical protein
MRAKEMVSHFSNGLELGDNGYKLKGGSVQGDSIKQKE